MDHELISDHEWNCLVLKSKGNSIILMVDCLSLKSITYPSHKQIFDKHYLYALSMPQVALSWEATQYVADFSALR